jgi:hypothetical protein
MPTNLFGKPEGRSPLGKPMSRMENNIKTSLREIRYEDVEQIHLA